MKKQDINKSKTYTTTRPAAGGNEVYTSIPSTDEILDYERDKDWNIIPDGDRVTRLIRHVPGQPSIFVDRQSKDVNNKKIRPIRFIGSSRVVSGKEITLMEYLDKCNYNGSNPERNTDKPIIFNEWEPQKLAAKANEKKITKINAGYRASTMKEDEMRLFLMVRAKSHTEAKQCSSLSESEMRFRIIDIAEKEPEAVMRPINSKADRYKYALHYAASVGTIKLDEHMNVLKWPNGDIFASGKQGINVIDYFVTLAQGDVDAGKLMDEIISLSKVRFPDERPVEEQIANPEIKVTNQKSEKNQDWLDKWIYEQVRLGKIVQAGPHYKPVKEDPTVSFTHPKLREWLLADKKAKFLEIEEGVSI